MGLIMSYPRQNSALSDQRIYKMTFKCTPLANLKNSQEANLFVRQNATTSHRAGPANLNGAISGVSA